MEKFTNWSDEELTKLERAVHIGSIYVEGRNLKLNTKEQYEIQLQLDKFDNELSDEITKRKLGFYKGIKNESNK